jgi:hypothetical protein
MAVQTVGSCAHNAFVRAATGLLHVPSWSEIVKGYNPCCCAVLQSSGAHVGLKAGMVYDSSPLLWHRLVLSDRCEDLLYQPTRNGLMATGYQWWLHGHWVRTVLGTPSCLDFCREC